MTSNNWSEYFKLSLRSSVGGGHVRVSVGERPPPGSAPAPDSGRFHRSGLLLYVVNQKVLDSVADGVGVGGGGGGDPFSSSREFK